MDLGDLLKNAIAALNTFTQDTNALQGVPEIKLRKQKQTVITNDEFSPLQPSQNTSATVEEISDTNRCNASQDTLSHFTGLADALQKIKQPTGDEEVKRITPEVDATQIISEIFGAGDTSDEENEADMETEETDKSRISIG